MSKQSKSLYGPIWTEKSNARINPIFRKKTERYPGEWRNEKRGLGGRSRDEWIEKEKARGEISYAQAAGAVKQEKPAYNQPSLRNHFTTLL